MKTSLKTFLFIKLILMCVLPCGANGYLHDIAVVNVTTEVSHVCTGQIVNITVVVENNGDLPETFDVTAYRDDIPIGTQTVENLNVNENTTLFFLWDTSGLAPCHNWEISAEAPLEGDTNPSDNIFIDGYVKINMPGDVNGDGIINIVDIVRAALAYNATVSSPNWDPCADIEEPFGVINILDLVTIAANYGKTCS